MLGFPRGSASKESTCNVRDLGPIPGLGRSPEEGNSYPLQYSGLVNSMDCIVHGVAESDTTDFHFHYTQSAQFSSVVQSCPTRCDPMNRSTPGLPVHHQLPEFTQTHVHRAVMPSSHLILCRPFLLLPPTTLSIRVFSNELALCIRWPKYWRFSFSVNPSSEHPGLISFRMDWLDLLAVQGTLKSLLQHHS